MSQTSVAALLTDRYELTMLEAALRSGLAERRAVFEVFARRLPPGRRFGVVAGQGRLSALLPRAALLRRLAARPRRRGPVRGRGVAGRGLRLGQGVVRRRLRQRLLLTRRREPLLRRR